MSHRRALLAWVLGSLFFFYAFVLRVSPSVMVQELMRDFSVSAAILGHLSAFYFYAYAGLQIPIGVLLDRFGPRRLMTIAALLCGIGCLLFANSEYIQHAYWGRLLIGAGAALSWVGTLTIIAHWLPPQRFAFFTGMTQFCGMAGAIFGQAPLAVGVEAFGWRSVMLANAGFALLLVISLWLVVRDRKQPSTANALPLMQGLRYVMANPQTWLAAGIGLSLTGPVLAFASLWGVPYMRVAYDLERSSAAASLAVIFIGWAVGAPLIGWLSDRLQRRKPLLLIGGLLSLSSMLGILYLPNLPPHLLALLFFFNGIGGANMILTFASAKEHNIAAASGVALGVVNTAVVGSGALLQPLIGLLLDWQWQGELQEGVRVYSLSAYNQSFLVLPMVSFIGILLTLLLRETYCRQQSNS